ncbi:MAG: hypothetical protein ACJAS1_006854 [Oleiphilaceae bacterium]|jgi:hypothetical protein
MSKSKLAAERKKLQTLITHLNLNKKDLLIDDSSDARGTLKKTVHPFVKDLLSSR